MNALFYFAGYDHKRNQYQRFAVTVLDTPYDRYEAAKGLLMSAYPELTRWSGEYLCLTVETVFKEI